MTFIILLLLLLLLLPLSVFANDDCICDTLYTRPPFEQKPETARWMVHALDYGVLSTISSRPATLGMPFGNVYSFVDGPCSGGNSTGTPYFYGTYMDQTFKDMQHSSKASFTLSEASLCHSKLKACYTSPDNMGDAENPTCARLTLSGELKVIDSNGSEADFVRAALYERHPQMQYWPKDHGWVMAKLVIQDIWLIDYYGGASIIDPEDYFAVNLEQFPISTEEAA